MDNRTPTQRFDALVTVDPETGCHEALGQKLGRYMNFSVDGVDIRGHVFAWERVHGFTPDGHEIHHLCNNKRCSNEEHLVALTLSQHKLVHLSNEQCRNGHPYTEGSVHVDKKGHRNCRTCKAENARKQYASDPERHRGYASAYRARQDMMDRQNQHL